MPAGLQIFDANANLIFDQTSNLIKFFGQLSIGRDFTGPTQSGSFADVRFTSYPQHIPFYARIDGGYDEDGYDAVVTFDGNVLHWDYPNPVQYVTIGSTQFITNRPNQTFIFGIL